LAFASAAPLATKKTKLHEESPVSYHLVTDPADLAGGRRAIRASDRVALDTGATGLNPPTDRAPLPPRATDCGVFVLDLLTLADVSALWAPLAGRELVCHNAAFDLAFLWRLGFRPGKVCDLMLLSRLLTAGTREGNALADLAQRHLGIDL